MQYMRAQRMAQRCGAQLLHGGVGVRRLGHESGCPRIPSRLQPCKSLSGKVLPTVLIRHLLALGKARCNRLPYTFWKPHLHQVELELEGPGIGAGPPLLALLQAFLAIHHLQPACPALGPPGGERLEIVVVGGHLHMTQVWDAVGGLRLCVNTLCFCFAWEATCHPSRNSSRRRRHRNVLACVVVTFRPPRTTLRCDTLAQTAASVMARCEGRLALALLPALAISAAFSAGSSENSTAKGPKCDDGQSVQV